MRSATAKKIAGLAVLLGTLALVVASVVGATPASQGGTTAALDGIPITAPPEAVASRVEQLARFANTDPGAALGNVRLARHRVGATATDIYTFKNDRGRPCVVVPDWIGFCEPASGSKPDGLDWSNGGGDAQTPSKFIAVYSDEIEAVTLTIDGVDVPVSMASNLAYAEFPAASKEAAFTARRKTGETTSMTVNLIG